MLDKNGNGTIVKSFKNWCVSNTRTPNKIYIRIGTGVIGQAYNYEDAMDIVSHSGLSPSVKIAMYTAISECAHEMLEI